MRSRVKAFNLSEGAGPEPKSTMKLQTEKKIQHEPLIHEAYATKLT